MRRPMVAGNWKMNGSEHSIPLLLDGIKPAVADSNEIDVVVFPPFVYLGLVRQLLAGGPVAWGAQNVCEQDTGAFTGEISASMIAEFGCKYVLIGHSERRSLYGDTDAVVAEKFLVARRAGLTPVLCVGETLEERDRGVTETVVGRQVESVLTASGVERFNGAVIAYEPVWAIGTGKTASPEEAQAVHAFIRSTVAKLDAKLGASCRIVYGGSVKGSNAVELFRMPDIDGGLIGGASLKPDEFVNIARAAS